MVRTTLWSMQEGLGGQWVRCPEAHSLSGRGFYAGDGNGGRVFCHAGLHLEGNSVSLEQEGEIPESLGEECELCAGTQKTGPCRATAASTWHLVLARHHFNRGNPQQLHETPPSLPVPWKFRWHPVFSSKTYFPALLLYPSSPLGASISISLYCSH